MSEAEQRFGKGWVVMTYKVGVEDIEPDHWVAWAFARPGLTGKGHTAEAAVTYLQSILSDDDVQVVERFNAFPSHEDPDYMVNAFFEDDRRPMTRAEINTGLDELVISRREIMAQIERANSELLARAISGEKFKSIYGIVRHVALVEGWYCDRMGAAAPWAVMPLDPLAAVVVSRENTRVFLPTLAGDNRIIIRVGEVWSARKVLRRILWHERDHTDHITQRLQELMGTV